MGVIHYADGGRRLVVPIGARIDIQDGGVLSVDDVNHTATLGSANYVWQQMVLLSDAQIKALPTTGVQIIPAPGVGRYVLPVLCALRLDNSAGVYTANAAASWVLVQGPTINAGGAYVSNLLPVQSALQAVSGGPFHATLSLPYSQPGAGDFEGANINPLNGDLTNTAVGIKDDWGGIADYTDGHASNTLRVTSVYYVLDTTTGLFVAT